MNAPATFSRRKWATCASRTAAGCASRSRSPTPTSSGCRTSASRRSTSCSTRKPTSSASGCSCRRRRELAAQLAAGAPLVTIESQTPVGEFDIFAFSVSFEWDYTNVADAAATGGHSSRARRDRTHHDPLVMIGGAVTFVNPEPLALFADVIAAGEGEALIPSLLHGVSIGASDRDDLLRRLVAANAGSTCRPSTTCSTPATAPSRRSCRREGTGAPADREEGGAEDDGSGRSAGDDDLHARHGVRLAFPRRSRARLREPVPVLLGGLQLPAGPRVSRRSASCSWPSSAAALESRRPGVDRAVRPPGDRGDPDAPGRDGLQHQPGVAAARRSHADDPSPAARERRADDHDRARDRLRSACGA